MKKIGILTFHTSRNYGAILQCYALQQYLKSIGHDVEVINYRPEYLLSPYRIVKKFKRNSVSWSLLFAKYLKWCIDSVRNIYSRYQYVTKFNRFVAKYINISPNIFNAQSKTEYDYYVIGSDQVWNPNISKGLDEVFFGNFHISSNAKILTYAASSSYYSFTEEQKNRIETYLQNYSHISVREKLLGDYLKTNFDIDSQLVCDPTLLVDRTTWNDIAVDPKINKYLLAYFSDAPTLRVAKKIAKDKGLKIISIYNIYNNSKGLIASPDEFVGLFKHAEYVVSSSFHGLSFSLIFKREFCVVGRGTNADSRLITILDNLNIQNRFIYSDLDIETLPITPIDYDSVYDAIDKYSLLSKSYLKTSIK